MSGILLNCIRFTISKQKKYLLLLYLLKSGSSSNDDNLITILRKKISNYFVYAISLILGFYCHFYTSKYKHRSSEKDCQIKKSAMINWGVCNTVRSIFKTIEYGVPCGSRIKAETIMKLLFTC